ncbi:MAG: DNA polymerase III subunit delta [Chloroflexi bacterium]|nr:DNA polymerase III subunit delta [Chloroflexota bacterium]MBE3127562.1 DNA polymerase III subunit delta [Candidatus Atribacteria bacterium]
MNYENMLDLTKQEKIYPVYLFYGKENYLKEDISKKLRNRLIDSAYSEFNYNVFYGEKLSINEVINDLDTLPLMSKHKLVVIKEAEKINKNDETKLINYFNRLSLKSNFSTLIIIYKESSPNKELITAIKRIGIVANFSITDKAKLALWIKSKFKQSNKNITQEALFYLQSIVDSDLGRLFNEIEKIDIYTKDQQIIEKEDVMITMGGSEAVNIFKVLDSVGDKDIINAIDGLVKLNQGNLHHLSIFAMIYRQIKLIFQTKLLLANGFNFKEVEKKLKLPYFVVEKMIKQSKKYTFKEIDKSYELLNIADLELKDSQKEPKIILEELVMNIINQK